MATCADCVHVEVCIDSVINYVGLKGDTPINALEREVGDYPCCKFKDRSRFVELPCKVGDTVYILGNEIFCDEIDEISIEKLSDGILCFRAYCKELKISLDLKDFGTIAFLTKEQAERALKERERE